jgi:hypothetical protein
LSVVQLGNTGDASVIADAVKTLLDADSNLSLRKTWLGDPVRVPITPSAAVVTGPTIIGGGSPTGAGMSLNYYTNFEFTIYVMVFYAKITSDNEVLEQDSNRYAEQVRNTLHSNKTLNGLAWQSWVRQIEPGVARRAGAKLRAHRLTAVYSSKTFI